MTLLTISEVCDALRISRSKLYTLWEKGEGPEYLHIGSQRRVRADVLDDWICQLPPTNHAPRRA